MIDTDLEMGYIHSFSLFLRNNRTTSKKITIFVIETKTDGMNHHLSRRSFLRSMGITTLGLGVTPQLMAKLNEAEGVKPIEGSWFEFQHHSSVEGKYWNPTLAGFTAEQWDGKIKEMRAAGIRYFVLMNTAIYDKTFYPSTLLPQHQMGCDDPLEAVLTAADKYGVNFFISNGFYGDWTKSALLMQDKNVETLRLKAMNELAEKYAHHKSFYGWYYPNETGIQRHYDDFFIRYVNTSSAEAAQLTPHAKTLIAPYGTRNVTPDETYVRQLEKLDVDYIAYQDEIGVEKTKVEESAGYFKRLHDLHKKAAKAKLWADVEVFKFEGKVYQSALLPAEPERVIEQLKAVSPYVEKILIYQYIGLLNHPKSRVFAGRPESALLYERLAKKHFLKK